MGEALYARPTQKIGLVCYNALYPTNNCHVYLTYLTYKIKIFDSFMLSTTVYGEGIVFYGRPSVRPLTNIFVWRNISLLSRWISV